MDDLIAFLRARLDERERLARTAGEYYPHWTASDGAVCQEGTGGSGYLATGPYGGDLADEVTEHIALNDPALVRGDVAAWRAILHEHNIEGGLVPRCGACVITNDQHEEWPCPTVRHLASVYASHPDYREEWRP